MRREEIDRLLARLSSGEITSAERAALYQSGLDDQALFEEIFAEQALAEALADEQLRDEFLIRESVREDDEVLAQALEEELASAPRLREVRAHPHASAPLPIRAVKRRIPWWGWAVPAAIAASTVFGVFMFRQPASDTQVARKVEDKAVQMAQAKPEQVAQPIAAPEAAAPAAGVSLSVDKSKQAVAERGLRKEAAAPVLGKSAEGAAAGRVEPTTQDLKDQPVREKTNEVAAAAPAPPAPVMIRGTAAAVTETPARRADEADARQAPAQVAEFRVTEAKKAASPSAAEKQNRAAAGASRVRNAVLPISPRATAAEMEAAVALAKSAVLQTQDASGDWLAVTSGARVPRDQKLRVKLTPTESGSWSLPGVDARSVALTAGQTGFLDLPAYAPGAHVLALTFQPAESAPARAVAGAVRPPLGRVSISFIVE